MKKIYMVLLIPAAVVIVLFLADWLTVTPSEEVEDVIYTASYNIENHRTGPVMALFSVDYNDDKGIDRNKVENIAKEWILNSSQIQIKYEDINVIEKPDGSYEAFLTMNIEYNYPGYPGRIKTHQEMIVLFRKEDGSWKITKLQFS